MSDKHANNAEGFVPVLAITAESGWPFIWILKSPDDKGVGFSPCRDEDLPLSEDLLAKFLDWQSGLDRALSNAGYSPADMDESWSWDAFHERGLQLSRWLKEEVGEFYRVVYCKSGEDLACYDDDLMEILPDGSLKPYRLP